MPYYEDVKEMPLGDALGGTLAYRFVESMILAHGRWRAAALRGARDVIGGD